MSVEERLREAGLELPPPVRSPGTVRPTLRPAQRSGNLVFLSGSGPLRDGEVVYKGKLGRELSVDEGYQAARLTGLNLLGTLKREIGDLELVTRWVKVLGMVNSAPGFDQQPAVINGFSDLIVELFGEERGLHARSAVGMAELPSSIAVEIEAIVEVR
jgi:enamine deaminase RidA (YjgF/YER057c/UK114 family)